MGVFPSLGGSTSTNVIFCADFRWFYSVVFVCRLCLVYQYFWAQSTCTATFVGSNWIPFFFAPSKYPSKVCKSAMNKYSHFAPSHYWTAEPIFFLPGCMSYRSRYWHLEHGPIFHNCIHRIIFLAFSCHINCFVLKNRANIDFGATANECGAFNSEQEKKYCWLNIDHDVVINQIEWMCFTSISLIHLPRHIFLSHRQRA